MTRTKGSLSRASSVPEMDPWRDGGQEEEGRPTSPSSVSPSCPAPASHQEGAEHVEADEVVVGEVSAARVLLARGVVRLWVTQLSIAAGEQDLLPGLTCGTPEERGSGQPVHACTVPQGSSQLG